MPPVNVAGLLLRSGLAGHGWQMVDAGDGQMLLRRIDRGWRGPDPRLVARPVDGGRGCLWWHWTAPAPIAGIPIAPANHVDRTHRLVLSTLDKLGQAAMASEWAAPQPSRLGTSAGACLAPCAGHPSR
ncbi:hypothetical protein [Actinomadura sp. WMMA1423]|uniref:hypothetical protein n=1 Tax=Actinomadura sp. WMMA1423 TaxID=2591108 RepID=UPI001147590B|nr:hypothetical protein [Actinomadura sp. WMMA1423]